MSILPTSLYQCSQVKALDKAAIEMLPITGFELMMRAGQLAFDLLKDGWPHNHQVTVFCGAGNNGGDGYIVAGLAHQAGLQTKVYYLADPHALTGEAKLAFNYAAQHDVVIKEYLPTTDSIDGLVVDALIGIGLVGDVRENYARAIDNINASKLPVLSIDIPSGICGDTGKVLGNAVRASRTISYIGLKQGLLTGDACDYVGELSFADLGVRDSILETQKASCSRLQFSTPLLPKRHANAHKGMFGRVLVVAGDKSYGGAGIMAAESALLCGAGIVELATQREHVAAALARRPELIVQAIDEAEQLKSSLDSASVLVLGPGLGTSSWSKELFKLCINSELPMVLDADGLNLLATHEHALFNDNWVLTPHPGEAARLLKTSTRKVQNNRFAAAQEIQNKYGGVTVLKGAGTIIASDEGLHLCSEGNPAMSTPGMGDVLSGIIGGFLAHRLGVNESAKRGVWAHATAADQTVKQSGKNLLATEIYSSLRELL